MFSAEAFVHIKCTEPEKMT